jgi:hypothetical protein
MRLIDFGQAGVDTDGTGVGRFTHSLGLGTNYIFMCTSRNNANMRVFNIVDKQNNYVDIRVNNANASPVLNSTNQTFDYVIIGW